MTIYMPVIVSGVRTLADGSIRVTLDTNELSPELAAKLMTVHRNKYGIAAIRTEEFGAEERKAIEAIKLNAEELGTRTPSERLRAALYRLYEQQPEGHTEFSRYYEQKMSQLTELVKSLIE